MRRDVRVCGSCPSGAAGRRGLKQDMSSRPRRRRGVALLRLATALALAANGAWAANAAAPSEQGRGAALLASLAARRAELDMRGIALGGFVQLDGSHVLAGGVPHSLSFDAQRLLDLALTLDTDKLLGWPGGTLFLDAQSHSGANVITHQVPALADPDNMDAYAETSLDRAWFEQDLLGRKLAVRVGLMYVDDQFFTVPFGQNFLSLDFSSDASISTFVLPTYPKGAWGADAFLDPSHALSFSLGVFRDHETELPYDPGGQLIVSEEAWRGRWRGLALRLQVGGWVDTGRFQRFEGGVAHHAAGAYLIASGRLWQSAGGGDRGIGAFVQYGSAPPAVAAVRQHFGAGLVWSGPWAARPHDELGIAYSDSMLSGAARFTHSFESEVEAYYQIDASHGWTVQPDLEYWEHPGGADTPATLLGLIRIMLTF